MKYNKRRDTRKGDKLQARFTGPYEIGLAEVLGRGVYRLKDGDRILKQCVNATNLKPWAEQLYYRPVRRQLQHRSKHRVRLRIVLLVVGV